MVVLEFNLHVCSIICYQIALTFILAQTNYVHSHRFSSMKGDQAASSIVNDPKTAECTSSCQDDNTLATNNKWSMPLLKSGEKRFYLGTFFKANWYRAAQFCRYHGMNLASINSQEENDKLEKYVNEVGHGFEHFWTSGTDLAEEGSFFWLSTGRPITFSNWNSGEPNNFKYENGEEEHCLELWNNGKGLRWNDSPCSFETYFICEG